MNDVTLTVSVVLYDSSLYDTEHCRLQKNPGSNSRVNKVVDGNQNLPPTPAKPVLRLRTLRRS